MLKDRIVRIKLKKHFKEQRPISYVGKVTSMNDYWVVVDARALMLNRHESVGVQSDKKNNAIVIPRDNIESIRVLPDSFDAANLRFTTDGQQLRMIVDGALDCYIGELGEG